MYIFFKLLSLLPLRILYFFAGFLFFIVNNIINYRNKVLNDNLSHAFPEWNEKTRKKVITDFYISFSEFLVETIKIFSIKKSTIKKRCNLIQNEALKQLSGNQSGAIVLTGHFVNWEWAGLATGLLYNSERPVYAVYKPLKSQIFNTFMHKLRSRFGVVPVPMKHIAKKLFLNKDQNSVTFFLADQTPTRGEAGIWIDFFNRKAPFFTGPVKLSQKLNIPLFFGKVVRTQRGHYDIVFELIAYQPNEHSTEELMHLYVGKLEQSIKEQTYNWLWSHRRWKHSR